MFPMLKFVRKLRRHRRHDSLVIECAPLHTERPEWAAHAPAQVEAAFKRGAHVVGFTELGPVHKALVAQLRTLATRYGYEWVQGKGDTAMAVKSALKVKDGGSLHVNGSDDLTFVEFEFHGSRVTVYMNHWLTNHPANMATRQAQTAGIIAAMDLASKGAGLSFFMADSNTIRVMSDPSSHPRAELNAAGYVLVYEELKEWPAHIGVNMIGRCKRDGRVNAARVETHDALGSDHIPVTATYRVRRG